MKGDRFERLEQLRKEAAERLRLPLDHDKTQLLAALRLNHETLVEKLVAGSAVNPEQLLALSEAIDKLTPELPPQKITVEMLSVATMSSSPAEHRQFRDSTTSP